MPRPNLTGRVARYYDQNTSLFMRLGGSGDAIAAIHREIWAPGVLNRRQAFEFLNSQVVAAVQPALSVAGGQVLDLGCGIGGTTTWVSSHLQVQATGITLSRSQVGQANRRAARLGLAEGCTFIQGDFHSLPPSIDPVHAAWAIEAFAHSTYPAQAYQEASRVLAPGGRLIIVDDFLHLSGTPTAEAARWLASFQTGWGVPNVQLPEISIELATQAGLKLAEHTDLTPYIRTVPAWLIHTGFALLGLPVRSLFWESLRGSTALQECLRRGWTGYHILVFEKQ